MTLFRGAVGTLSAERPIARRVAILALLSLIVAMLTSISVFGPSQTASAAPICTPGTIYVNTGGAPTVLNQYTTTGELASSVPTSNSYTDIAFSADGLTLYGILPGSPAVLYTIDPDTGAETASVPVAGLPGLPYYANALSALADGSLLVGAAPGAGAVSQQIFRIDPVTGVATPFAASFPAGFGSAGDFLSLSDGDVLAVGSDGFDNVLFRIKPDSTVIAVGTVPLSYGAAQDAGRIYLAGATGDIYEITSVPTAASTAPVATTTIASTGLQFFGATARQDAGTCSELTITKTADPASGTAVALGQTVTYAITLGNITGTAAAVIDLTDDLTGILDDAAITTAPAVISGVPLTIGPVSDGGFRVTGLIPPGEQSTITYAVTIDNPATGDRQLDNYVIPTGTTPPATCDAADLACTTHPISDLAIVKSVDPADQESSEAGQQVTYSFLVTNTGGTTLTDVSVAEGEFTGSGELGAVVPAVVDSLAPGASTTFTATYTLTQADVDRGTTSNTATATGLPPTGPRMESPPSTVVLTSVPAPGLSIVKSVDAAARASYDAGQSVTYSFLVTNTGNTTLTDVTVAEGEFTGSGALGALTPASVESLAPGASTTFTATYTLTQADVDRGTTSNTATATALPPAGERVESAPSTVVLSSVPATVPVTVPPTLATTGSEPWWAALLAASFLVVLGGALRMRSGSRLARR